MALGKVPPSRIAGPAGPAPAGAAHPGPPSGTTPARLRPRFIVDLNVGRLATWLRVLGYDAAFPRGAGDNELVRLALREDRVLVTRDRGFLERRAVRLGELRLLYVTAHDLPGQLRQLVAGLDLDLADGFTRCLRCNLTLTQVEKSAVLQGIPAYVAATQQVFHQCPGCRRVYWPGTHWTNMTRQLAQAGRGE